MPVSELLASALLQPAPVLPADEYDFKTGVRNALGIFILATFSRAVYNLAWLARTGPSTPDAEDATPRERISEEVWTGGGALLFAAWSWWALLTGPGGCSLLETAACLDSWPRADVSTRDAFLFEAQLGWHAEHIARPFLNLGHFPTADMVAHYVATFALICLGYRHNALRLGVMAMAVFHSANPLLHASKVCHFMDRGRARSRLFGAFGIVFLVTRVVLPPLTVMKCAFVDALGAMGEAGEDAWKVHAIACALLGFLYVLQLWWLHRIVAILRKGEVGKAEEGDRSQGGDDGRVESESELKKDK